MGARSCLAIELDPAYVDVAIQRWQAFTGNDAILDGSPKTFADVAADRRVESTA
jgi:DNA modification methylase